MAKNDGVPPIRRVVNKGPRLSRNLGKRVACAAPTFGISHQDTAFNKSGDVTQCRVVRTFRELSVFHASELSLEAIEQAANDKTLPFIQKSVPKYPPKVRSWKAPFRG